MQELKLPNGQMFFHLNRGECSFLYDEIFKRRCYANHGITLGTASEGCVVDVGANIGMSAYFFATQCPGKKIYAFEPSPKTFEVLAANVARLRVNAELFNCALSSAPGKAIMTHYPNNTIMSGLYADPTADAQTTKTYMINEGVAAKDTDYLLRDAFTAEHVECEVRTLSSVITERSITRIDLLKIDVEKAELDVLAGIDDSHWNLIRQVAIEVHDVAGRVDTVKSLLERHGLRVTVHQDPKLKATDLRDVIATR